MIDVEKMCDKDSKLPFPISKFKKRCIAVAIVLLKKLIIPMTPLITLYNPKSSTPNAFSTIRDVYKLTSIVKSILVYNKIVL